MSVILTHKFATVRIVLFITSIRMCIHTYLIVSLYVMSINFVTIKQIKLMVVIIRPFQLICKFVEYTYIHAYMHMGLYYY